MMGSRREWVWALTVGVVLADSSIVTLALPEILAQFQTSVFGVSWVLTAFNLVFALAMIPAARLAQARLRSTWTTGLVVFAGASLACAIAPSIGVLIAARCIQALGGAAVVAGSIELLAASRGSHSRAASAWGTAGLAGLAIGPALGGLLTEVLSWESIFFVQVPVMLLALGATASARAVSEPGPAARLELKPELALGLLSAGLTGALFLLVIMLTQGFGLSPIETALVVSAMPLATLGAELLARRAGQGAPVLAAGAIFMAGGLAALGLLPGARWIWTIAPQLMVGIGLALAIPGLTQWALSNRDRGGRRGAATIAARHAGVVIGIVLLTPIFDSQLAGSNEAAQRSGAALLLDAPLSPETKIALAESVGERIEGAGGRLPDLAPAFADVEVAEDEADNLGELRESLTAEVEKASVSAFSLSFLIAGGLALAAAIPIAIGRGRRR
jgi:MFS family permease